MLLVEAGSIDTHLIHRDHYASMAVIKDCPGLDVFKSISKLSQEFQPKESSTHRHHRD